MYIVYHSTETLDIYKCINNMESLIDKIFTILLSMCRTQNRWKNDHKYQCPWWTVFGWSFLLPVYVFLSRDYLNHRLFKGRFPQLKLNNTLKAILQQATFRGTCNELITQTHRVKTYPKQIAITCQLSTPSVSRNIPKRKEMNKNDYYQKSSDVCVFVHSVIW
jgi:hypothetical protein